MAGKGLNSMVCFLLAASFVLTGCSTGATHSESVSTQNSQGEGSSMDQTSASLESFTNGTTIAATTQSTAKSITANATSAASRAVTSSRAAPKTGYISKPDTSVEPERSLSQILSVLSASNQKCDSYDLDKYTLPFWKGNIVYNESLNFIKDPKTGVASAPLLYKPAKILSVKNSLLNITYQEGVDYTCENGKITLTPASRIHCFNYSDIYFNSGNENSRWALKTGYGYKYTLFREGTYFHENQVAVTYLHTEPWTKYKPSYQGDNLPNIISKLKSGKPVKIVFYGDSITKGANASGMFGVQPKMPIWADMVTAKLREAYPKAQITTYNPAENATNSSQGLRDCKAKVADQKPDLVIMGYGMNDGSDSNITPGSYQTNIKAIMDIVKTLHSSTTDFILVATTLPNQEIQLGDANMQASYESKLYELERKGILGGDGGVIVADMTRLHTDMLKTKRFFDLTANNVNHPNDFLIRAQAACILTLLVKG